MYACHTLYLTPKYTHTIHLSPTTTHPHTLLGLECVDHDLDRALEKVLLAYDTLGQDLQTEARAVFVSFCEALKHPTTRDLRMCVLVGFIEGRRMHVGYTCTLF